MRTLNFTSVNADKNGLVREAVAVDGNVTYTISRYNPHKDPVHFAKGFSYVYVMDIVDTKAGKCIHNTGLCSVGDILSYLFALELSMWGIKPVDVQSSIGAIPFVVDEKVIYADPECSHVTII